MTGRSIERQWQGCRDDDGMIQGPAPGQRHVGASHDDCIFAAVIECFGAGGDTTVLRRVS